MPCDPKKQQSNAKRAVEGDFHAFVDMETEDSLKRGAIMVIPKKLAWHMQTYSTIYLKIFFSVKYSYGFNIQ